MKGRSASVFANPVLVGAVTVLVVIVAVFLSYNANNGLPFVPTTSLKVRFLNGQNLVKGNEIRSGGFRIGIVDDMKPVQLSAGQVGAELKLKLDKTVGKIPADSRWRIRPRSALGLKYLELTEGHSKRTYRDGDTVPIEQTQVSVDLDEVFKMFDPKTRAASQQNLQGFGDSFAGRGAAVGRTVEEAPRLFGHLQPVARNLADPKTELPNFFKELGDAARIVAPISKTNSRLFTTMADTWEAVARDPEALRQFISKQPPTMDAGISSFRVQRPFLAHLTAFSHDVSGATHELRGALPDINPALETGTRIQRRVPELNKKLEGTFAALQDLTSAPSTNAAIRALTATVTTLNPQLRFYGPYVTVCNAPNYFFTYLAEHFSEPDTVGESQRALANSAGQQDDSLGAMGADQPANGHEVKSGNAQFLHGDPYGAAITPDGRADCEAGQRGYPERNARFYDKRFKIDQDARTPGAQGPTFSGRPRVPAGQTYTSVPETGAYAAIPTSSSGER
ncbi:MAG: phospholipid/cholesterol/gamma-HCH transport system substrate-binding protein [Solirubrobacteraceae bacterium]|jgi:ABC-type transporter Mla subunit MlaD|nr:phospholipid/cholesterol/gamma-HCH transport system substrate-binding protein [Solirubrobacteraceae bacterium]